MAKILLRSARDPFDVIEAGDPRAWGIGFYGTNVGNLLFADSTHRLLSVRDERSTPIADDDPIAVSMSPLTSPWFETYVDAFADRHPQMTYVGQTHHDFAMLQWGRHSQPEMGIDRDHRLYFEDRTRMFLDAGSWMRFLATQRFAFGTRIHGNVAAVLAGTPAMVIAHDSRVLELCDYHDLPYTMLDSITHETTVDELFQAADVTSFHNRLADGWKRLTAFLDDSGLANVAQPGQTSAAYDTEHADTAAKRRERELEKQLTASVKGQAKRIAALESITRKQQARIERQTGRLDRQRALIDELRADLAPHQERAGLRGFVRRVRRWLRRSES